MNRQSSKNHFFGKLILFACIFCIVSFCVPAIATWKMQTHKFVLPEGTHTLLIGDSHIAQGVDDGIIPGAFNSSVSADTYLTAFLRLQLILRDNPGIRTVLLGVSPYSLAKGSDETIFRPSLISMKVPYYLPFFGTEEWQLYLSRDAKNFLRAVFLSPSEYLRGSKLNNKKYLKKLGKFNPRPYQSLDKAIAATKTLEKPFSWGNSAELHYLEKICAYCHEKNLRLIFLNTPIYNAEKYLDTSYFYKVLNEKFPNIELWDYMKLNIPDSHREDINHLNEQGARAFSQIIAKRLENQEPEFSHALNIQAPGRNQASSGE